MKASLGTILAAGLLAFAGCGSSSEGATAPATSTASQTAISKSQAEAIWLKDFLSVVEAHGAGESAQHLNSPGVEQTCKAEEGAYHCKGIVPEETGQFVPGHETNCTIVQMVIDHSGHVAEESADPIQKYREAFHSEVECHL